MLRRSMRTALETMETLHEQKLGAFPRNYELWYTYLEGQNADLNAAIDGLMRVNGRITHEEADAILRRHMHSDLSTDTIDQVCASLTGWLYTIVQEVAAGSTTITEYSKSLETATEQLAAVNDPGLRGIVGRLVAATDDTRARNEHLERSLGDAQTQLMEMRETLETVSKEVITDQLTSLTNRRYFDHMLAETMLQSFHAGKDMALIMGDVDNFKAFNDTWGHQTGDQVLKIVSTVIRRSTKGRDIACRYGGEEFAIILPDTKMVHASKVADDIRAEVMTKKLVRKSSGATLGRVTMSFGVTALRSGDTPPDVVKRADRALYAAKHAGRNCVKVSTDTADKETNAAA